jgi:hypothetical protein
MKTAMLIGLVTVSLVTIASAQQWTPPQPPQGPWTSSRLPNGQIITTPSVGNERYTTTPLPGGQSVTSGNGHQWRTSCPPGLPCTTSRDY